MTSDRTNWDVRHSQSPIGEPEAFLLECLELLPGRGKALDVAAGRGRNSLPLAARGFNVIAIDFSLSAMQTLLRAARAGGLPVMTVVADLENYPLGTGRYDLIVNVNYLDRARFGDLRAALKPGGYLLIDTYLIDQAEIGHPRSPQYLLQHYELKTLLSGMKLIRYREGLAVDSAGTKAWRASALAAKATLEP